MTLKLITFMSCPKTRIHRCKYTKQKSEFFEIGHAMILMWSLFFLVSCRARRSRPLQKSFVVCQIYIYTYIFTRNQVMTTTTTAIRMVSFHESLTPRHRDGLGPPKMLISYSNYYRFFFFRIRWC